MKQKQNNLKEKTAKWKRAQRNESKIEEGIKKSNIDKTI